MKSILTDALVVAVMLAVCGVCMAEQGEAAPEAEAEMVDFTAEHQPEDDALILDSQGDDAAKGVQLMVTVVAMKGLVQYRVDESGDWQRPEVGQALPVGVSFRTGPRSAVRLSIPPDQVITLDRLGTVKVLQALFDAKASKVKTDVGMKYGRTTYEVEAAGVEHDSTIHSPGATLAIRGTEKVTLYDQGARMIIGSARGTRTTFTSGHVRMVFGQGKQAAVTEKSKNAADQARRQASNGDPMQLALTDAERRLVEMATSGYHSEWYIGRRGISYSTYAKRKRILDDIDDIPEEQPQEPDRIPGDINNSGIVDKADWAIFKEYYRQEYGMTFDQGDFTEDGKVLLADFDIFGRFLSFYRNDKREPISSTMAFPDATGDGKVNDDDLKVLRTYYRQETSGGVGHGDFNGDGKVTLVDLDGLGQRYIGITQPRQRAVVDYGPYE